MKIQSLIFGFFLLALCMACEKDNYAPPTSQLIGSVVYNNQPIGLRSGGVQLELWQPGFALNRKIPVYIDQNGSFSAALFDGTYKLTFVSGNGPWVVSQDTILLDVKGDTQVSVPVKPFFIPREEKISVQNGKVSAAMNIERIDNSRTLQNVGLYVGTTAILDNINNKQRAEVTAATIGQTGGPVSLEVTLPASLSSRDYIFARLGIRVSGVNEMIFSPVVKLELK